MSGDLFGLFDWLILMGSDDFAADAVWTLQRRAIFLVALICWRLLQMAEHECIKGPRLAAQAELNTG